MVLIDTRWICIWIHRSNDMSKKRQAETAASQAPAEAGSHRVMAPPLAPEAPTLPLLAERINQALTVAAASDNVANQSRIDAGRMLQQVRARIPKGFVAWCANNIKRSKADVYRCLKLVENADPTEQAKAQASERATRRASDARRSKSHD